ncbi:uncharacterized protein EKO05_0007385 [Ascochyta rabiei]|uniref:Zinc ion binding n=1 Tax=Didymella rabiei TaxID=5454 RepID=A0A163HBM6_DIDRA|nr:uncharacterized protein EKO05_0007385 [Ascochyta rabiei]KZM25231.1 zinc ion binding [Ascochyta rabiei]UPX17008.1 hypothetical protein EKO05_0007385 [Ascochyta rabiei]
MHSPVAQPKLRDQDLTPLVGQPNAASACMVSCSMETSSSPPSRPLRKRKAVEYGEDDYDDAAAESRLPKKAKKASGTVEVECTAPKRTRKKRTQGDSDTPSVEKRLRRHRARAPASYLEVKGRALTQRLTVLSRERCGTDELPEEKVVIAGSTGNLYQVHVNLVPSCDCPHAKKGNQCKHIVYVMLRVLKAREDVAYQLALISSELRHLIENAPLIPGVETDGKDKPGEDQDGNRKPIEGECPICYDELDSKNDVIVYCKASCGNNVHKACMQSWIQVAARGKATCPYCRATWDTEEGLDGKMGTIDTKGLQRNEDGYLNAAGLLGLSGERDYSSYHQFWVRRQLGRGWQGGL